MPRRSKSPRPPILDAGRPIVGSIAPFTPDEAREIQREISRICSHEPRQQEAFENIRNALISAKVSIQHDEIDRNSCNKIINSKLGNTTAPLKRANPDGKMGMPKLSDALRPLKRSAQTGHVDQGRTWLPDAVKHGAAIAGMDLSLIEAGDPSAIRSAAKAALASGLYKDRPGRPRNAARDEYASAVCSEYERLKGRGPTYTRTTTKKPSYKRNEAGRVKGEGADFMRAALAPFGVSEEVVAAAILRHKKNAG